MSNKGNKGNKFDSGKPRCSLIPTAPLMQVVDVLTYGATKYAANNWKQLDNAQERYADAALRHIYARLDGESTDVETGKSHLAHAICCLLFWLWFDIKKGI